MLSPEGHAPFGYPQRVSYLETHSDDPPPMAKDALNSLFDILGHHARINVHHPHLNPGIRWRTHSLAPITSLKVESSRYLPFLEH